MDIDLVMDTATDLYSDTDAGTKESSHRRGYHGNHQQGLSGVGVIGIFPVSSGSSVHHLYRFTHKLEQLAYEDGRWKMGNY